MLAMQSLENTEANTQAAKTKGEGTVPNLSESMDTYMPRLDRRQCRQ